ncbi:type I inositol polyphosphate 5-phosphatase 1-like [Oryza brachyantha]|uniref:type I inositol polyphosphate 5-phosphatase 1-like n=1 Tax=Oryza brachyantha TaxID=4533 RepID=UPI0007763200|nr:type I inositol polyphosphate 5-phosphatase 1-like [Oryza brachyantha]
MSIYQTMFCFVCTHLATGEKAGVLHNRNADVQEIHRRTHFTGPDDDIAMPRDIYDHEINFWLGDLNYRIDIAYERAHELIAMMDWHQLAEKNQVMPAPPPAIPALSPPASRQAATAATRYPRPNARCHQHHGREAEKRGIRERRGSERERKEGKRKKEKKTNMWNPSAPRQQKSVKKPALAQNSIG